MELSGNRCNRCHAGAWSVYCVRETREHHIRYLKCDQCGATAKSVMPHSQVVRRKPRVRLHAS